MGSKGTPTYKAWISREWIGSFSRTVLLLWHRELIRLWKTPLRLVLSLVTPLMFLVVFATGLDASLGADARGMESFRAYMFPGVLIMCVQAPAVSIGVSLVWDRQRGVLRQVLSAPVPRSAVVWGLALAGTTIGGLYALPMVLIAGYANIPYGLPLLLVWLQCLLVALLFTALGLVMAVTIKSLETFQTLLSLALMPVIFLSGAMFPPGTLTGWLGVVVRANPVTYIVDAMRRTLPGLPYGNQPEAAPSIFGWHPPIEAELVSIAIVAALFLSVAAVRFNKEQ